jgi:hypothetical protein
MMTEPSRTNVVGERAAVLVGTAIALCGCSSVEASGTALVLLDDEARAAGIEIAVDGEAQADEGPIAVPSRGRVEVRRGLHHESLETTPGEVVAIEGAEGRVRHGVDPGRLVLDGDRAQALSFAELAGVQAVPLPDGRFLIDGENAMWTALL